eukprot:CAMPEP_0117666376 /NCGR_PEP_ID=MMETSP0804-20121206/10343_1 /TAXON_ID=1074897 /ORGANISM="Tetraselmis astigmatica, Strain CCMP880" /LENGTH=542 /DNA_ID=CAMNT_0005473917 /DNA_START=116 /DNA_END=1740 /DNA_ORIENTATION=+
MATANVPPPATGHSAPAPSPAGKLSVASPAAAAAAPQQKLDSRVVGQHFVGSYYGVLQKSPAHLHRFFKKDSMFSHQALVDGGKELLTVPAKDEALLQERINQLYPSEVTVDVQNVDSQPSLLGGIIVQVIGELRLLASPSLPRPFAQTFFLAVQPGGYFVLNDILRYTSEAVAPSVVPMVATGTPVPASTVAILPASVLHLTPGGAAPMPPVDNGPPGSLVSAATTQPPPPHKPPHYVPQGLKPGLPPKASLTAAQAPPPPQKPAAAAPPSSAASSEDAPKTVPPSQPAPQEAQSGMEIKPEGVAPKEEATVEAAAEGSAAEPPPEGAVPSTPLTYAERMKLSLASKSAAAAAAAATAPAAAAAAAPAPVEAPLTAPVAGGEATANGNPPSQQQQPVPSPAAPNSSVFIRYLPAGTDVDTLAQQFAHYGPLLPSPQYPKGINLKSQGLRCYAFVDFATQEAAAAAIERGITVGDKTIAVEEKRPNITRSGGRGTGGRGDGGRRDGGRGGGRDNSEAPRPALAGEKAPVAGAAGATAAGGSA